jgi:hypothetical protein
MSLTKFSLGRNHDVIYKLFLPRKSLVSDIPTRDRKNGKPYLQCSNPLFFTNKKENKIYLIYKEIQSGAFAKSYIKKGFLIYKEMRKYFLIYEKVVKLYMTLQLLHSKFPNI